MSSVKNKLMYPVLPQGHLPAHGTCGEREDRKVGFARGMCPDDEAWWAWSHLEADA